MLYTLSLQSACVGFLFHWLISDAIYLHDNPTTRNVLYFLFITNLVGLAYGHIVMSKEKDILKALDKL